MTVSEWLVCEDPQAMLRHFSPTSTVQHHKISDRKLLMFSYACGKRCGKSEIDVTTAMEAMPWAMRWANPKAPTWIKGPNRITQKEKADFLRDIVGNPFRAVVHVGTNYWAGLSKGRNDVTVFDHRWLTPTVLAIAQSAYDERPGRKCERCSNGTLMIGALPSHWKKCPTCHGTGRIEDGTLDPVTLTILADAIEDAGCDSEYILMHLRGKQQCNCEGSYDAYTKGCGCNGSGWKTMEGHHVRGCHVLDIILGKE